MEKLPMTDLEFVTLSPASQFERIYLVSGLRRSGNHLLLQMLACSFTDNRVLFINDIPDAYFDGLDHVEEQFDQFITKGIVSKDLITINYGKSLLKCGKKSNILDCMIPESDIDKLETISTTWTDRTKILIISLEDQEIDRMDQLESAFSDRCHKLYKIIILRDILNCISSRFAFLCKELDYKNKGIAPTPKYEKLVAKGGFFKTDGDTLNLWGRHVSYVDNPEYIIFNYNQFLCSEEFKRELCSRLDIELNPDFYKEIPTFGHGSSYAQGFSGIVQDETIDLKAMFTRFNNTKCKQTISGEKVITVDHNFIQLLRNILSDTRMLELLRDVFSLNIKTLNEEKMIFEVGVCGDRDSIHISIPDLITTLNGGNKKSIKRRKSKNRLKSKRYNNVNKRFRKRSNRLRIK